MRFLLFVLSVAGLLASYSCKSSKAKEASPPAETAQVEKEEVAPSAQTEPRLPAASASLSAEQAAEVSELESMVSDAHLEAVLKGPGSEHWYGFYLGGRKAGYAVLVKRPTRADEPGVFMHEISALLKADGAEMKFSEASYYAGSPSYATLEVRTEEINDMASVERRLVREGDKTRVETMIDGKAPVLSWAPEMCGSLRTQVATFSPDFSTVGEGSSGKYCSFETEERQQELSELRVDKIEKRVIGGVRMRVAHLAERSGEDSTWTKVVVSEEGTALEVNISDGIALKLEDKELAQSSIEGFDMYSASVKVDTKLGDPSKLKELKLRAYFVDGYEPPASQPNQEIEKQTDKSYLLTIRSIPGAKVKAEERAKALVPSGNIDSESAAIVAQAQSIAAGAASEKAKVAAVNRWVYRNLAKSFATNMSTASQVLEHRTGDCTEHTVLLVALLRALKIPARELTGLIYLDDDFAAFGWHAWAEVEIDGHWVQVDPSWDETVGNATHINLGRDGMANLGSMRLEVL